MANSVLAHDVFIASPGGLSDERDVVRKEIAEFNEERMVDTGHAFIARGWEDTAGALGRAQSILNTVLGKCDYLILILADRWGTPPGGDGSYSSGTEEEFRFAHQLVNESDAPMQDILLLFKGLTADRLRDPGPQLKKVLDFKTEREESHDVYYKTFDSSEELRREVRRALQKWSRGELRETSHSVTSAPPPDTPAAESAQADTSEPLRLAKTYEESGLVTQAEHLYAEAVADEDIEALAAYARFLRRTGRPTRSVEVNDQILTRLAAITDRDTSAERARVLTNIGIAHRKLSALAVSRQKLQEAVATARSGNPPDARVLAYALDNLAITMTRMGDLDEAEKALLEAKEIRNDSAFTDEDRAESSLNIARLLKRRGDLEEADRKAREVLAIMPTDAPHRLRAASMLLIGEVKIARGDPEGALPYLRSGLEANEALAAPDYIAMCAHQLASASLALDRHGEAEKYAERALNANRGASNREGELGSLVLLARVFLADGRAKAAVPLLQEAIKGYGQSPNRRAHGWALKYLAEAQDLLEMPEEAAASRERAAHFGVH